MAATHGNQWWKLRAKHGRDKMWSDPKKLWESCMEYLEITAERKITKKDWVGKYAEPVMREMDVPFTITGLCIFLDMDLKTWNNYKNNESYKDFFPIIARVEEIMKTQKFEGATTGIFNANIIAMDLGLKVHSEININERKQVADIFPDELDETEENNQS